MKRVKVIWLLTAFEVFFLFNACVEKTNNQEFGAIHEARLFSNDPNNWVTPGGIYKKNL